MTEKEQPGAPRGTGRGSPRRGLSNLLMVWATLLAVALLVPVFALGSGLATVHSVLAGDYAGTVFLRAASDDPPASPDPQCGLGRNDEGKDVAQCIAYLLEERAVMVEMWGGYPSYGCTVTTVLQNSATLPERREPLEIENPNPEALQVEEVTPGMPRDVIIYPGQTDQESFRICIAEGARQSSLYTFLIRKRFSVWADGTIGFWGAWASHNTYTRVQIEAWLKEIGRGSRWYATKLDSVAKMQAFFDAATAARATSKDKFLGHYLATQLNYRSARMDFTRPHDLSGVDPGNYLGLANPRAVLFVQIVEAIEAKVSTTPSAAQYEIMKNVAEGLNRLSL